MSRVIKILSKSLLGLGVVLYSLGMFGCDRMVTPRPKQLTQDAEAKADEGKYLEAINLYEAALDGSEQSAEIHYKLGLLYDDKMSDPLNALHHFKRFLTLNPAGKRAEEVKGFMKRDELTLLTKLSGDGMVTRAEAVRLQNENLSLRKQIDERWAQNKAASQAEKQARANGPNENAKNAANGRQYTVQRGDTLASISRKFYKSPARWGEILAANPDVLTKPSELKAGQTLLIP
ncbi:MAG: LysM peptidoglycan-binding domain-containing protein [Chthoniobacterales bacterium]|nr:LysM peptidoglycan-binding domain-containing protein [Chthoniobacterales bacterium]